MKRNFAALPTPINYTCAKCGAIISVHGKEELPATCGICGANIGFVCTMDEIRGPRV